MLNHPRWFTVSGSPSPGHVCTRVKLAVETKRLQCVGFFSVIKSDMQNVRLGPDIRR